MPLVTVLTPAHYSARPYLAETAESVLSQQLPDGWELEWVIQGDGPKAKQLRDILPEDPRISFDAEEDFTLGPSATRNVALTRARGVWVQNLDADDLFLPGGLATLLTAVEREENLHWAFSQADDLMPDGRRVSFDPWLPPPGRMPAGRLTAWMDEHGGNVPIPCAGAMYRTTTLRAVGGWVALPIGGDVALLASVSELTDGWQDPATTWLYRQHPDQISRHEARPHWAERARLVALQRISALRLTATSITAVDDETNHAPVLAKAMKNPVDIILPN